MWEKSSLWVKVFNGIKSKESFVFGRKYIPASSTTFILHINYTQTTGTNSLFFFHCNDHLSIYILIILSAFCTVVYIEKGRVYRQITHIHTVKTSNFQLTCGYLWRTCKLHKEEKMKTWSNQDSYNSASCYEATLLYISYLHFALLKVPSES